MRWLFRAGLALAAGILVAFLALPLLAVFLRVPPSDLVSALGTAPARDALLVSLKTSLIAHGLILAIGTPAAYLLAGASFPGRGLVLGLIELPLVLPPAVAGIALLAAFGRRGLLGDELAALGVTLPFTQVAVVLAIVFVASPFYVRTAIAAFEAVDRELLLAARSLGAGPARVFARVALPLAAGGLGTGSALAWARGLGEFGATIIFAGSLQGLTQTLPLAIYGELVRDFDVALALGALLVAASAAILIAVRTIPAWIPWTSSSTSGAGPSA